jgi:DNA-binding beta-propeller fold protein YncE
MCHACIAPDGFVFVAEHCNNRVRVLTPDLDVHCTIGQGQVRGPAGVCANADVVVVSEYHDNRVAVFNRGDGALLRRFGTYGDGDGGLSAPRAVRFLCGGRHVAVVEAGNNRVSVFTIDGEFIRHIGVGVLGRIVDMAVSAFDEIVVSDRHRCGLRVFSSDGDLLATAGDGVFTAVAVHGSSVFACVRGGDAPGIVSVFE